jgi:hypothetical protein
VTVSFSSEGFGGIFFTGYSCGMADGGTGDAHDYEDDGPGFCFNAIPDIALGHKGCGPLNIALDTSVLINFTKFGRLMLDDGLAIGVGGADEDVLALGNLLSLWMSRAIRFHLSPLNVEDAKRSLADDQREEREQALFGLAAAITCHNGSNLDWSVRSDPSDQLELDLDLHSELQDITAGLPNGYDRRLVREALAQERHVFLTCDKRLVNRSAKLAQFGLLVCLPSQLMAMFAKHGVDAMSGGTIPHEGCPYAVWMFGDTHKWLHLDDAFGIF